MTKKPLLLAVATLALLVIAGTFWFTKNQALAPVVSETSSASTDTPTFETPLPEPIDTSNWKTYRNEEYGFEVKVPKEWKSFQNIEIEKRTDGGANINFLFETKDSRWSLKENCQGRCVKMFVIGIMSHEQFNKEFIERFSGPSNAAGKPPVVALNKKFVFTGGNMAYFSSDPPEDLSFLRIDQTKIHTKFIVFDPIKP